MRVYTGDRLREGALELNILGNGARQLEIIKYKAWNGNWLKTGINFIRFLETQDVYER